MNKRGNIYEPPYPRFEKLADHLSPQGGRMRKYELTAIFPMEEDQHKEGRERLLADLAAGGAEIETVNEIGERDLAYEINKRTRGRYVLFNVKLSPESIVNFDRVFKLNNNLVRYLFVRIDE
jgi:small subunit ribosomal protein S6